jgi:hypothetical protein
MGNMMIGVYNSSKAFLYNYAGSYQVTTVANSWQQVSVLYTAQAGEAYVEVKYCRLPAGQGPTDAGSLWADDFSFAQGVQVGPNASPKTAFNGSMVQVDSQGNWSVLQNGTWQPYFVIGVYNDGSTNTAQTYSNQGFNTLFTNSFSLDLLQEAQDAVSSFNPGGMMCMIDITPYLDPRFSQYDNLTLLEQNLAALEASPLLSDVLGFYWDNEQYANYTVAQSVTSIVKQYDTNAAGQQQHPILMLGGQQGTNPLYDGMANVVGDYLRDPETASYLGPQQDIIQRSTLTDDLPGQTAPFSVGVISNEAYWNNFNALVYEDLIAGGRGFSFWADGINLNYNGDPNSAAATNITLRDWWAQLPGLVTQIDQLAPLLAQPLPTTWGLSSSNYQVACGVRAYDGQGYALLANPTATAQTVTFTAQGLWYTPSSLTDYFSGATVATTSGNSFTLTLQPYQTAVYCLAGSGLPTPTVTVTDAGGTYSGSAYAATATVTGTAGVVGSSLDGITPTLTYYAGTSATGTPLAGAPSAAGTYTVLASYAGDANYQSASAQTTFTIAKAVPTLALTEAGGVYTGAAFTASATVAGVNGIAGSTLEGVGLTFTYYAGSSATGTPLSGAPTAVGTYTVVASFAGTADYAATTAQVTFSISQATPTIKPTAGGTYSGAAIPATATITGVSGTAGTTLEGVGLTFTYYKGTSATGTPLSGAPTAAGTYTVVVSFAGSADYKAATAQTVFTIAQACPTITVTVKGGTWSGATFPATATVAGVSGVAGSTLEGVGLTLTYYAGTTATGTPLSGPPSAPGTYTVLASFAGSADYKATTKTATYTISQAKPTITITDNGGTWSGATFPATATVAGLNGIAGSTLEGVGLTLTYYAGTSATGTPLSGAPSAPGTYTVLASFAGSTDYAATTAQVTFSISQATPTIKPSAGGTYNGSAIPATATITGVSGVAGTTLEGVGLTFTYYAGSTATGTPLSGAPTAAGTYTVVVSFAGSTDYKATTAQTVFTIAQACPTIAVTVKGGTYSGATFPATATVAGVNGTAGSTLEGVGLTFTYYAGKTATGTPLAGPPSAAGTYTVLVSFAGSADYKAVTKTATYTISQAKPTVTVTDKGGTYTGSAYAATATVAGVSGVAASTLEGVGITFTYYAGTSATGTPLSGAPSAKGTYTVVASFAGSTDYLSATAQTTFTIS